MRTVRARSEFLLLRKWAKRRVGADFGRKLVAHMNSGDTAKTNRNNIQGAGAGSRCKLMRVHGDKQSPAGDLCCGAARPHITSPTESPASLSPVASLQICFVSSFLLVPA